MHKSGLILLALCAPTFGAQYVCTSGVQTPIGYSQVTAICNIPYTTHGVANPTGNEGMTYDLYYLTAAGLNNHLPMEIFNHGGGNIELTNNGTAGSHAADFAQRAADGFNEYVLRYTSGMSLALVANVNSGASQASVQWNGGFCSNVGGWTGLIDQGTGNADTFTVTGVASGNICQAGGGILNITRSAGTTTHTTGTYLYVQSLAWPVMIYDYASFLSFLGQCAAAGLTPGIGVCAAYPDVPGDPNLMASWGESAGAQNIMMVMMGNCHKGSTCTLVQVCGTTPGCHEWNSQNWTFRSPLGSRPIVLASMASNTGEVYSQNRYTSIVNTTNAANSVVSWVSLQNFSNLGSGSNVLLNGTPYTVNTANSSISLTLTGNAGANSGVVLSKPIDFTDAAAQTLGVYGAPACNPAAAFNPLTLNCPTGNQTAAYTQSLGQSVLYQLQNGANNPVPILQQTGQLDIDFPTYETMVSAYGNFLQTLYTTLGHGLDYGNSPPSTSVAFQELRNTIGVNPCIALLLATGCPVSSGGGGIL